MNDVLPAGQKVTPDPGSTLRAAVQAAQVELLKDPVDRTHVERTLAALLTDLGPVSDKLNALVTAEPAGPVAHVLAHVRAACGHAVSDRPEAAVTSLVTASAMAFRLADDAALATDRSDFGRWR